MNLQRLFLLAIFCAPCIAALAQTDPDYIVTSKADTLYGKVKIFSFESDQAQVVGTAGKKILPALQVTSIHLKGEDYSTQRHLDKYRFMKVLKKGYLSLYAFREKDQTGFDGRYLVKRDGSSLEIPNLSFRKLMSDFLIDCPEISGKVETGELTKRQLDEIIDSYNNCIMTQTANRFSAAPVLVPQTDPRIVAVERLQNKVAAQPEFPSKKDATDLLADIRDKIKRGQSLPGYLIQGLKEYLGTNENVKPELTDFLTAVGK